MLMEEVKWILLCTTVDLLYQHFVKFVTCSLSFFKHLCTTLNIALMVTFVKCSRCSIRSYVQVRHFVIIEYSCHYSVLYSWPWRCAPVCTVLVVSVYRSYLRRHNFCCHRIWTLKSKACALLYSQGAVADWRVLVACSSRRQYY
jgi:hypothetical protein